MAACAVPRGIVGFLAFSVAVLPLTARASADAPLTLLEVQAHVKAARGNHHGPERIVESYIRHGMAGTETEIASSAGRRTDFTFGPFTGAYGSAGGTSWSQNENGETVVDSTTAGEGADSAGDDNEDNEEMTVTKLEPVSPGGDYVISTLTKLGFGKKQYVEPATWHVVRVDRITPNGTRTTTYSDFRTTNGYTRPWHWSTTDGHKENDSSVTITSIDSKPIPDSAFTVPPDARQLVEFPPNVTSVVLPCAFDERAGKFIVRVTIANRGLDFMLDTGAGGIVINRAVAQQIGLKEYDSYSSSANAGRYVGTRTIAPEITVGSLKMENVEMDTIPDIDEGGGDRKIVGLLGFDFIDAIGLKLDYQHGIATAYDLSAFSVPAAPKMIDLDVRLADHTPETTVSVNGATGTDWTVDTGGAGAVMIMDYFRRRNPGAVVDEYRVERPATLEGVGGDIPASYVKLSSFTLGQVTFKHFGAYALSEAKMYGDLDGIVGPDLLRLFTVYIDYKEQKMRLIPNDAGSFGISK